MPILNGAKVTKTAQQWESPDGNRRIHQLTVSVDGVETLYKTFSDAIAVVGWEGDLEAYDKPNPKGGNDTFVKQHKEDGGYGRGGGKPQQDPFTMYLSYSKDLVVALQMSTGYEKEAFENLLKATINGGKALFDARPDAPHKED